MRLTTCSSKLGLSTPGEDQALQRVPVWSIMSFQECSIRTTLAFGWPSLTYTWYDMVSIISISALWLYLQIFGGTNWGNVGHPGGYTSYDYGSALTETRNITREKYSDLKLLGNFAKVSPSYLLATPGNLTKSVYTNTASLSVTPLKGDDSTSYFVIRHSDYSSQESTSYKIRLPTSAGNVTIPQLGGSLSLNGRDSKIHVADYNVSGTNIIYSTAEIFTWKQFADSKVLVLYGVPG